jgi:tRNA(Ile)-lysidine synthase TilS/MesJ
LANICKVDIDNWGDILRVDNQDKKTSILEEKMFEDKYQKLLATINEYDLIPEEIDTVAIAMSGGKDAQVLALLLSEYKKRVRTDLTLEIVTVTGPAWKYAPRTFFADTADPDIQKYAEEQEHHVEETKRYWENKGIAYKYIDFVPGIDEPLIQKASKPCVWCFIALNRALFKYLSDEYSKGRKITLATGITKFDLLYVLESLTIRSGGKSWEYDRVHNPNRYYFSRMQLACFSPYPKIKIGIPNCEVSKITPIINLTDNETRVLANTYGLPRIPDPCSTLFGDKYESDKRHFDRYLQGTTTEDINVDHVQSGFFSEYQSLLDMFTRSGLLPPVEEIDNVLYEALYNDRILSVFKD